MQPTDEIQPNITIKTEQKSVKNECKDIGMPGQKVKDKISLIGKRFGKLTVIKWNGVDKNSQSLWLCECDCGIEKRIKRGSLLRKDKKAIKSCGCLHLELINSGKTNIKHGQCGTKLYSTWAGMIQRCTNPNQKVYIHYGGRGIKVCKNWSIFNNFYNDIIENIGDIPKNKTLDRKENNLHYSCGYCEECIKNGWKFNCQWSTMKEQTWHTRHNKFVIFNNETKCIQEWAEIYNINPLLLSQRLRSGWTMEDAINFPPNISLSNTKYNYTFNGKTQSLTNWSNELNIPYQTLYRRINNYKWSIEKTFTTPK